MNMSLFSDIHFDSEAEMNDFLMSNALAHKAIAANFFLRGQSVPSYPLESIGDLQDWLSTHAALHQQELKNLGTTESFHILDDADWNNEQQFKDWMFSHALLHQQVNQALGITG